MQLSVLLAKTTKGIRMLIMTCIHLKMICLWHIHGPLLYFLYPYDLEPILTPFDDGLSGTVTVYNQKIFGLTTFKFNALNATRLLIYKLKNRVCAGILILKVLSKFGNK